MASEGMINDFNKKISDLYDQRKEFANQGLISASILLSITPDTEGLENLDFSDLDLNSDIPADQLLSNIPLGSIFLKDEISVLDFACGTGLPAEHIFRKLKPGSTLTGVDISEGMLSNFNKKFPNNERVKSYQYNLLDDNFNDENKLVVPDTFKDKFDIIFCVLSYHHLGNVHEVNKKLISLLKPKGYLVILDFYNPDMEREETPHRHHHLHDSGEHHHKHSAPSMKDLKNDLEQLGMSRTYIIKTGKISTYRHIPFIKNHCSRDVYEKLEKGELQQMDITDFQGNPQTGYLVTHDMILAVSQK